MKRILGWGIAILLLASVINDVGRYFTGAQKAAEAARQAAVVGAQAGRSDRSRTKAWRAAYPVAKAAGARAENIELTQEAVTVYVAYDVRGTWIAAPVSRMLAGDWDVFAWWNEPIVVHTKGRSLF